MYIKRLQNLFNLLYVFMVLYTHSQYSHKKLLLYVNYYCTLFNCFILLQIVGWGKTEKYISSTNLLEAYLPYIDHSSCRNMYTGGFEFFVTADKFCAGSAMCNKIFQH